MWNKDLRNFVSWYNNEFKFNSLYKVMANISEDSPHHREVNIAAHTDMVVMSLLALQSNNEHNSRAHLFALFVAAFHDVGKPASRTEKFSADNGKYYSFAGHELRSSRLWWDYYASNIAMMQERFGIKMHDAYEIAVMIEKHLPWNIKNIKKKHAICDSIGSHNVVGYLQLLAADSAGRISDNVNAFDENIDKIRGLYATFNKRNIENPTIANPWANDRPILVMPIAQSGAGKSTTWDRLKTRDPSLFQERPRFKRCSMDIVRTELYGTDYEKAFKASTEDKNFMKHVQHDFITLVRNASNIYVDNTNLSAKRRNFYITEARRRDYKICAFLYPMSIQNAVTQNSKRTDKKIPHDVVIRQYMSMSMPLLGDDFDEIMFIT